MGTTATEPTATNAAGEVPPTTPQAVTSTTALTPAPAAPPASLKIPVQFDPNDPVSLYMDTGSFEQLQRVARMMASSSLVPQHLRNVPKRGDEPAIDRTADCFLVAAQAFRWRMDCFAVAQHTFVTSGKLGYEGKLIAALINASGRTEANLEPIYSGPVGKPERGVQIVARLKGEKKDRTIDGTVAGWKTENQKWNSMPDQMLFYRGAREWARRHMPEVMLGIQADEELGGVTELERGSDGSYARPNLPITVTPETLLSGTTAGQDGATPGAPAPEVIPPAPCCGKPHKPSEPCPPPDLQLKPGEPAAPKGKK